MTHNTCLCGCGERTRIAPRTDSRKGWVKGQPLRYLFQHHRRLHPLEFVVHPLGCWEWARGRNAAGYGLHWRDGQKILAHRAYYEEAWGPIPEDLQIDHLCRNPSCVNPAHLEAVTNAENTRRGAKAKLNLAAVRVIRQGGHSRTALAVRFGVSLAAIDHVLYGDRWREAA